MLTPLVLATQPRLLSVNLTNNLIAEVQAGAFANMTRLVRLILTKNKIQRLEDGSLTGNILKIRYVFMYIYFVYITYKKNQEQDTTSRGW